jgi:hypothetical protein
LNVPQIKELELTFYESHPKHPQGKWPVNFSVIEAKYSRSRIQLSFQDSDWQLNVHPVPRNMRAEIREALTTSGFKLIAEWLSEHAKFSGRESYLNFTAAWNSELKKLDFGSRDYVLPEVPIKKEGDKK